MFFSSSTECIEHLKERHQHGASTDAELGSMVKLAAQPLDFENGIPCPLKCGEILHSVNRYERHVGHHQEQLALFALPSLGSVESDDEAGEDNDADDASVGANSVASGSVTEQLNIADSSRRKSIKKLLRQALQMANQAVQLDNSHNYEAAKEFYHEACDILQTLLATDGVNAEEDKKKLAAIVGLVFFSPLVC
jgi:hypothetical protein